MLLYAAILFALAAVGGLAMLAMRLKGKPLPMALGVGHGLLAALGLILVITEWLAAGAGTYLGWALGLFVLAALGGFALFVMHLRGKQQPVGFILVHGLLAVVAFVLLLLEMRAAS
jgi:hypothetical protein